MTRYSLTICATLLAGCCALEAQTAPSISAEAKQAYGRMKNNLTKMAEKMPEENYSFKATPDIRTFGQLIAHIADSQARACSTLNGEPKALNAGTKTAKADLVAALKESFTMCDAAFEALTDANATEAKGQRTRLGILVALLVHGNEEYGYTAVYMRLKGVVPPSSEPR